MAKRKTIQKLNSDLRAAKKKVTKKKAKPKPPAAPQPAPEPDMERLVRAIENSRQPIVNIEPRKPVAYNVTVNLNSRGDMVGARIEPIE